MVALILDHVQVSLWEGFNYFVKKGLGHAVFTIRSAIYNAAFFTEDEYMSTIIQDNLIRLLTTFHSPPPLLPL